MSAEPAAESYDDPDWPVTWVSIDPPQGSPEVKVTVTLKVPPGSRCEITYLTAWGARSTAKPDSVVADTDGNAVLTWVMHRDTTAGEAGIELTNTKTDGSKIIIVHPYTSVRPQ